MGSTAAAVKTSLFAGLLLLSGCPHPDETIRNPVREDQPTAAVRRAEESFNPSDYDPVAPAPRRDTTGHVAPGIEALPKELAPGDADRVPGYRVQLISTTSIDEANAKKLYAESLFPAEWFYLEYDPPTYKIRAGNFLVRFDAERFRALITARGFPGAWVVPDRVFNNPPLPQPLEATPRPR